MSSVTGIRGTERGVLRVFTLADDIVPSPLPQTPRDKSELAGTLLGAVGLDGDHVDVFDVGVLDDLGLRGFLAEGGGVSTSRLAEDADRIDAVTGKVMIVYSMAARGRDVALHPAKGVGFLGSYGEVRPDVHFTPLPTTSSAGSPIGGGQAANGTAGHSPHLMVLLAVLVLPLLAIVIGLVFWGLAR